MSLAFLSKPIGGSKKDAGAEPDKPSKGRTPGPVRGGASTNITVGGAPRADLMPPEIRIKRSQLRTRRSLRMALFGVFVVVVVACGATWAWSAVSQTTLASARQQAQQLLVEQGRYSGVTTLKDSIALVKAGQVVGDSTEINWNDYVTKVLATLPSGLSLDAMSVDTATPFQAYSQSDTPLQGGRIASFTLTAKSDTTPTIPPWLDALATLPGFVDATPGSVTLGSDGIYTSTVVMHIGPEAFASRFAKPTPSPSASTGTDGEGN